MSDFALIHPTINDRVKITLNQNGDVVLELGATHYQCNKNESLLWALCIKTMSTLRDIEYQLNTIAEFGFEGDTHDFVDQTIALFERHGFLSLFENQAVNYPVDTHAFSHFVSARGGLYALNHQGYQRLAYGMFFGLCFDQNTNLMAFEFPHRSSSQWRLPFGDAKRALDSSEGLVRRLDLDNGHISAPATVATNLASNCHYLVRDKGDFFAVDTVRQQVVKLALEMLGNNKHQPVVSFPLDEYYHINSLAKQGEYWLLTKAINSPADLQSGFYVFNENWQIVDDIDLPAERAHDYLLSDSASNTLEFWYCDSNNNQIKQYPSGKSIAVAPHIEGNNTTRGLSETAQHWVVGNGRYGRYYAHLETAEKQGAVSFINKHSHEVDYHVLMPEAPCCIIKNPFFVE